jgi:flagellar basal-body rod protein FlgB
MDLLSVRQKLVASNIANADTPGYHTQDIDFQAEFHSAMGGAPRQVEVDGMAMKNDGNNVSIDREARLLAENAMRFQMASNLIRGQVRAVRSAIQEGVPRTCSPYSPWGSGELCSVPGPSCWWKIWPTPRHPNSCGGP